MVYDKNEINKMAMRYWLTDDMQEKEMLRNRLAEESLKVCYAQMTKMAKPDDKDTFFSCANITVVKSIDDYNPKMLYVGEDIEYEVADKQETLKLYDAQIIIPYCSYCSYLLMRFKNLYSRDRADERYNVLTGYMQPYYRETKEAREARMKDIQSDGYTFENYEHEFGIAYKGEFYSIKRVLSLNKVLDAGENSDTEMGDLIKSPERGPEAIYDEIDRARFLNTVYKKLNVMKTTSGYSYSGLNMKVVANIFNIENGFSSEEQFKRVSDVYENLDPMFAILSKQLHTLITASNKSFPLSDGDIQALMNHIKDNYKKHIIIDANEIYGSKATILCKLLIIELLDSTSNDVYNLNNKRTTFEKVGEMYGVTRQRVEQELKSIIKYLSYALAGIVDTNGNVFTPVKRIKPILPKNYN